MLWLLPISAAQLCPGLDAATGNFQEWHTQGWPASPFPLLAVPSLPSHTLSAEQCGPCATSRVCVPYLALADSGTVLQRGWQSSRMLNFSSGLGEVLLGPATLSEPSCGMCSPPPPPISVQGSRRAVTTEGTRACLAADFGGELQATPFLRKSGETVLSQPWDTVEVGEPPVRPGHPTPVGPRTR